MLYQLDGGGGTKPRLFIVPLNLSRLGDGQTSRTCHGPWSTRFKHSSVNIGMPETPEMDQHHVAHVGRRELHDTSRTTLDGHNKSQFHMLRRSRRSPRHLRSLRLMQVADATRAFQCALQRVCNGLLLEKEKGHSPHRCGSQPIAEARATFEARAWRRQVVGRRARRLASVRRRSRMHGSDFYCFHVGLSFTACRTCVNKRALAASDSAPLTLASQTTSDGGRDGVAQTRRHGCVLGTATMGVQTQIQRPPGHGVVASGARDPRRVGGEPRS